MTLFYNEVNAVLPHMCEGLFLISVLIYESKKRIEGTLSCRSSRPILSNTAILIPTENLIVIVLFLFLYYHSCFFFAPFVQAMSR